MTTLATSPAIPREEQRPARQGGFRPDIEGLRAIAIGLVLIYHAGIPFLPGGFIGVDIFFVISGFLITGLLVREIERTGKVSLARFYARRAKRLLPATALVLITTTVIVWLTSSVTEWRAFGGDIVAAAAYVVNWRLAARSVDYLAEGVAASPVQHFWSLAVEEQFYIVWPLLLVLVTLLVRRTGRKIRPLMAVGLAVIVVPSLVWSVMLTDANPATAFFVTTTRLWELGIGALVAVGIGLWPRLPATVSRILGWAGLATLLGAAVLLDGTYPWPGAWALIPTLATAAIIIAGAGSRSGVQRLLSSTPAVWIGGLSYSLYLWHWPLLIGYENLFGTPSALEGALVMVVSFVPAWLSLKLVENPVRFSASLARSTRRTLALGAGLSAASVIAGLLVVLAVPQYGNDDGEASGAAALSYVAGQVSGIENPDSVPNIAPEPVEAAEDVPSAYGKGCQVGMSDTAPELCEYGNPDGEKTVVLAGDSKALQWVEVLDRIAQENDWRLLVATKSACGLHEAVPTEGGSVYEECQTYDATLMDDLVEMSPDAVIVSQRHKMANDPATGERSMQAMANGLTSAWNRLEDAGSDVIVLLDNPAPTGIPVGDNQVYKCVAELPTELSRCSFPLSEGLEESATPALTAAADQTDRVDVLDMTDVFCNEEVCPPVIGGALVYRQGSHITNTYALSATGILADRLEPMVDR